MAKEESSFDRRSNEHEVLIQSLDQIKTAVPGLSSVESCVMIGCGYGKLDLEFIRGCFPNITELVAVEPNGDQLAELKVRVPQLLPSVKLDYFQETAQSWKGAGKRFDAVLMFHSLYFVTVPERPAFFKKIYDAVTSGGLVFFLFVPDRENPCPLAKLQRLLASQSGGVDETSDAQVRDMMTSVGFQACYELSLNCQMNVENAELDDDYASLNVLMSGGSKSLEQVREAVKEAFGGKKTITHVNWLGVFRKP